MAPDGLGHRLRAEAQLQQRGAQVEGLAVGRDPPVALLEEAHAAEAHRATRAATSCRLKARSNSRTMLMAGLPRGAAARRGLSGSRTAGGDGPRAGPPPPPWGRPRARR